MGDAMNKRENDLLEMLEKYHERCLDYRKLIIEMVYNIDENDSKFLKQVYTIIHRHIEKRGH